MKYNTSSNSRGQTGQNLLMIFKLKYDVFMQLEQGLSNKEVAKRIKINTLST